jgi:hypothetical protein
MCLQSDVFVSIQMPVHPEGPQGGNLLWLPMQRHTRPQLSFQLMYVLLQRLTHSSPDDKLPVRCKLNTCNSESGK